MSAMTGHAMSVFTEIFLIFLYFHTIWSKIVPYRPDRFWVFYTQRFADPLMRRIDRTKRTAQHLHKFKADRRREVHSKTYKSGRLHLWSRFPFHSTADGLGIAVNGIAEISIFHTAPVEQMLPTDILPPRMLDQTQSSWQRMICKERHLYLHA